MHLPLRPPYYGAPLIANRHKQIKSALPTKVISNSVHHTLQLENAYITPTNEEQILLTFSKGAERLIPQYFRQVTSIRGDPTEKVLASSSMLGLGKVEKTRLKIDICSNVSRCYVAASVTYKYSENRVLRCVSLDIDCKHGQQKFGLYLHQAE